MPRTDDDDVDLCHDRFKKSLALIREVILGSMLAHRPGMTVGLHSELAALRTAGSEQSITPPRIARSMAMCSIAPPGSRRGPPPEHS
jgi:hypothetical protein